MQLVEVALVLLLTLQHGQQALQKLDWVLEGRLCTRNVIESCDYDRNLVDADVLLLGLDHPHTFLAHLVDDPKNVDHVVLSDALQDPVQGNEGPAPSNTGTARKMLDLESRTILMVIVPPAVDDNRALFRADSLSECPHEPADHDGHEHGLELMVLVLIIEKTMIALSWHLSTSW